MQRHLRYNVKTATELSSKFYTKRGLLGMGDGDGRHQYPVGLRRYLSFSQQSSQSGLTSKVIVNGLSELENRGMCRSVSLTKLMSISTINLSLGRNRTYSTIRDSEGFCAPKTAERLRLRDGMPKSYKLIYRSSFQNYLLSVQIIILVMAVGVITLLAFVIVSPPTEKRTEEEKMELRRALAKSQAENRSGLEKKLKGDISNPDDVKAKLGSPSLIDIYTEDDPTLFGILAVLLLSLIISLIRLQRLLPIRIYANNKKNCVAIYYGHFFPGRITHHEFREGTVRPWKSKFAVLGTEHIDGSGRQILLLEQFFRHPADYNKLLGLQEEFVTDVVKSKVRKH